MHRCEYHAEPSAVFFLAAKTRLMATRSSGRHNLDHAAAQATPRRAEPGSEGGRARARRPSELDEHRPRSRGRRSWDRAGRGRACRLAQRTQGTENPVDGADRGARSHRRPSARLVDSMDLPRSSRQSGCVTARNSRKGMALIPRWSPPRARRTVDIANEWSRGRGRRWPSGCEAGSGPPGHAQQPVEKVPGPDA